MRKIILLSLLLLWGVHPGFSQNTYYVSTQIGASDANAGTLSNPFATIQKAITVAVAGDSVVLRGGTYTLTSPLTIKYIGNASKWTVFAAFEGELPVISAINVPVKKKASTHITAPGSSDEGAFMIYDAAYIRIRNIKLKNSHNGGFNIRKSSYIQILNCSTDSTHCMGISAWYSHHILVSGNSVRRASTVSMDDNGDGKTGAHEAISFGGVEHFVIEGNEISYGENEGIDIKQASQYGIVRNNHTHHNARQGIYVDGYPYYVTNATEAIPHTQSDSLKCIEVNNNLVHDNNMGIVVSSEGGTPVDSILIHHNLVYNNSKAGIHIASYFGKNGPRNAIEVYNNTVYLNATMREYWWCDGGIFLETRNIRKAVIRNNICAYNGDFQIGTTREVLADGFAQIDYNLIVGEMNTFPRAIRQLKDTKADSTIYAQTGNFSVQYDPTLENANAADFHLKDGSPAIDAGNPLPRYNDPDGSRNDMGAFPFMLTNANNELKTASLSFFPNPTSDVLFAEGVCGLCSYSIFNTNGQVVKKGEMDTFKNAGLNVSTLDSGLYLIQITGPNEKTKFGSFIKKQ